MRMFDKSKSQDSLDVTAETIINATYGELIRLAKDLASVLPSDTKDPKAVAEALHAWATARVAPSASPSTLTEVVLTPGQII